MNNYSTKKEYQHMPFIIRELEDKAGGGSIAMADLDKSVSDCVAPGFFVGRDEKGLYHLLVAAVLSTAAAADATSYQVKKNSQFKIGQFVTSGDVAGVKAYAITAIDRSNPEYDVITVGTSLGKALPEGKTLHQVKAEDAAGGKSELLYAPYGVAKNEIDLTKSHAETGISIRGSYNVANMAYGAPKIFRDALPMMRFED